MKMVLGVVVACRLFLLPLAAAYTITYFDCADISKLATYQLGEVCRLSLKPPTGNNTNQVKYKIIQRTNSKRIQGFSCAVAKSKFVDYCGAYSHNKMAKAPTIETTVTLSPTTCMTMVNTQKFTGIHL